MPSGLSFLFQATLPGAKSLHEALTVKAPAPTPAPKAPPPDILHYLWLVKIPEVPATAPYESYLLTTVYDEDFKAYIGDLVNNNPGPFNLAAYGIQGFEGVAGKLPEKAALTEFIRLIGERDLTQLHPVGKPPFLPFYPWSAIQIHRKMGGGPAAPKPPAGGPKGK
jgi:hypothetical protein